jgi:hypothetical protein
MTQTQQGAMRATQAAGGQARDDLRVIGPDVKAMQSMLFTKGEGKPGQAWHQDEFFIPAGTADATGNTPAPLRERLRRCGRLSGRVSPLARLAAASAPPSHQG